MDKMKVYTHDEVLNRVLGEPGTAVRSEYESDMDDYLVGLAIRRAREAQNLTQEELGRRIGVQRARISSIEKGANLRLSTLRRIFVALGLEVKLDISTMESIQLC